jgi:hypothetical protein
MLLRDELLFAFFIRRSINRNVSPNFVIYFVFQDTRNREVLDIPRNNFKKIRIYSYQNAPSRALGREEIPKKIPMQTNRVQIGSRELLLFSLLKINNRSMSFS